MLMILNNDNVVVYDRSVSGR